MDSPERRFAVEAAIVHRDLFRTWQRYDARKRSSWFVPERCSQFGRRARLSINSEAIINIDLTGHRGQCKDRSSRSSSAIGMANINVVRCRSGFSAATPGIDVLCARSRHCEWRSGSNPTGRPPPSPPSAAIRNAFGSWSQLRSCGGLLELCSFPITAVRNLCTHRSHPEGFWMISAL